MLSDIAVKQFTLTAEHRVLITDLITLAWKAKVIDSEKTADLLKEIRQLIELTPEEKVVANKNHQ